MRAATFLSTSVITLLSLDANAFSSLITTTKQQTRYDSILTPTATRSSPSSSSFCLFATADKTETVTFVEPRIVVECSRRESKDPEQSSQENNRESGEDDYSEEDESYEHVDEEELERRRKAIAIRLIKLKRGDSIARSRSASMSDSAARKAAGKKTSIGERRVSSASRARGKGLGGQILEGVRANAAVNAARLNKLEEERRKKNSDDSTSARVSNVSGVGLKQNIIQSAIDTLLEKQKRREAKVEPIFTTISHHEMPTTPVPGTVLVPQKSFSFIDPTLTLQDWIRQNTSVRVATEADDLEIAKLRLSVFSDFSPEVREQFCSRSCHVLHSRRMKGATCLVASVKCNQAGIDNSDGIVKSTSGPWTLGSVECSTHEFAGTELGMLRPVGTVMYVTEVAVSPKARRCGAGLTMMKGIENLARRRGVETVYLHVDVENLGALELYEKAGFSKLGNDPIYTEFTTKLNLHDGATRGRCHYLMHKEISEHQTWFEMLPVEEKKSIHGTIGFDMSDFGLFK